MERLKIFISFFVIYVIYGSTYLAIRWGVEGFPPFLLSGLRFSLAGLILLLFLRMRGPIVFNREAFKISLISGLLLFVGGNGFVTIAEQTVSSGLAAVWLATVPVWILFLNWIFFENKKPRWFELLGGLLGLLGIVRLVFQNDPAVLQSLSKSGIFYLMISAFSWSVATLLVRHGKPRVSALLLAALQMLCGGGASMLLAGVAGDWGQVLAHPISAKAWGAIIYLTLVGSLIGFSAFAFLLQRVDPQKIATNTLVNPVIALLLGAALAGEKVTGSIWLVVGLVLLGVTLILFGPSVFDRRVSRAGS